MFFSKLWVAIFKAPRNFSENLPNELVGTFPPASPVDANVAGKMKEDFEAKW